jgi:hypothetical protein
LSFKGGTCLAKVHGDFYRLSEDLDFGISTPLNASRKERSRRGSRLVPLVRDIPGHLPGFQIVAPLRGANESTQYNAVVGYESLLESRVEPIGVEVGLCEPVLAAPQQASSKTMLLNPVNGRPLVTRSCAAAEYLDIASEVLREREGIPNGRADELLEVLDRLGALPSTFPERTSGGRSLTVGTSSVQRRWYVSRCSEPAEASRGGQGRADQGRREG